LEKLSINKYEEFLAKRYNKIYYNWSKSVASSINGKITLPMHISGCQYRKNVLLTRLKIQTLQHSGNWCDLHIPSIKYLKLWNHAKSWWSSFWNSKINSAFFCNLL